MAHRTKEVFYNELLDLKRLVKTTVFNRKRDDKGNTVNWLKVKSFRYEKQMPDIIQYKYELKNEYLKIYISPHRQTKNKTRKQELEIPKLYIRMLPISTAKKNGLLTLCRKNIIPQPLHSWYQGLPTAPNIKDTTAEPAECDSEEE